MNPSPSIPQTPAVARLAARAAAAKRTAARRATAVAVLAVVAALAAGPGAVGAPAALDPLPRLGDGSVDFSAWTALAPASASTVLAKDSFTRNGVTYEVDLRVPYPRPHYNLMFANVITDTQTGRKHTYAYDRGHAYTSALWFEQGGSRARITCAAPVNTTVAVTYVTDEPHSVATTQPAAEGDLATVSAAGSFDPRGGELAYAWDLDKDGVYDDGHQVEARFRAPVVGDYTLGLQVTDSLGRTSRTTFDVRAANAAPVVQLGGDLEIGADGVFEQDGSFTDPGADSWTAELSYGDGAPAGPLALNGKSLTLSHTYGQAGQYTVTVRVSDLAGASIGQAKVLVRVLAPSGASSPPAELAAGVRWPT